MLYEVITTVDPDVLSGALEGEHVHEAEHAHLGGAVVGLVLIGQLVK